ncbi:DUF1672 family protein [Metabacillus malikii]|uniref:DUF1672 family protein n=1 Tax=Metabacillus malikii TaxID=1504265 RepID=A0ABT9ZML6_9BACI|nr:DUF1672 family protein [Metabacillus malikii]MDQ0233514.1 hypothetical protein [Metabacillus malikii]
MKHKRKLVVYSISTMLLMGGCGNLGDMKENTNSSTNTQATEKKNHDDRYVSVQDYTGDGYMPRHGQETDKIAKEHQDEITKAVQKFFIETYKTEVKVHNVVGSQDAATVFVESVGEPHFYTYAVVPIDKQKKEVKFDNVFTQEGQVENAIKSGLYHLLYEEEFAQLDSYFTELQKKEAVVGRTVESLKKVGGVGYMTPNYFISPIKDEALDTLYNSYIENPKMDIVQMREIFEKSSFSPEKLIISIQLYMSKKGSPPSDKIFDQVCKDIKSLEIIPPGLYSVTLNDNLIDSLTAIGIKDNSLELIYPNYVLRE